MRGKKFLTLQFYAAGCYTFGSCIPHVFSTYIWRFQTILEKQCKQIEGLVSYILNWHDLKLLLLIFCCCCCCCSINKQKRYWVPACILNADFTFRACLNVRTSCSEYLFHLRKKLVLIVDDYDQMPTRTYYIWHPVGFLGIRYW